MKGLGFDPHGLLEVDERTFVEVQSLVLRHAGMALSADKRPLVAARLARRVRKLGLPSFAEYLRQAAGSPEELEELLDAVATHETRFFRDPAQVALLERTLLPSERLRRPLHDRTFRVWSAGCSTGEETYTVAMLARLAFPPQHGYSIEVLGTDLSRRAVRVASAGLYPLERAKEIPERYLRMFMWRGVGASEGVMRVSEELAATVRFERHNLHTDPPPGGPFQLILCRNVLIYFEPAARRRTLAQLVQCLAPQGLLVLGASESLAGAVPELAMVAPSAYARGRREGASTSPKASQRTEGKGST